MQKLNTHLVVLIAFIFAFMANVNAQTRTTVLLNKATSSAPFIFDTTLLPTNLMVSEDNVLLNLNCSSNKLDTKQIQTLNIKRDNKNIGQSEEINKNTEKLSIPLNLHQELPKLKDQLVFESRFSTQNSQDNVSFYHSFASSANYQINKQPKLVVNYEVTKEPNHSNWEQANANAQHTNAINWKWESNFNEITFNTNQYTLNNCQSDKTILYKGKPIVFEGTGSNCQMSLVNYPSTRKLWTLAIGSIPSKYPVIDKQGRMYLFLENNTLMVINLDNQSIIKTVDLNSIGFNSNSSSKINIMSINDNPTIGYDGTIYLPINNNNGRVGIVALSSFPDLKPRWFYYTTNPVSAVALTENEKFACFIESDVNTKKSKLVVLDNISGDTFAHSDDVLSSYVNDVNFYFPPVVTQKIDTDKTYIYVLNGNKTASKLVVFQINHNTDSPTNKIEIVKTITSSQGADAGISQPVVTANGSVFLIKDTILSKFDTKSKETTSLSSSMTFSNESEIIANATNQLIITSKSGIYYVDANAANPKVTNVRTFIATNEPYKILMTADFDMYRFTSNLCDFIKSTFSGSGASQQELSGFKNKTVYFYKAIGIKNGVTINDNINTILVANTIQIKKNFTVKKGANVSFKIN